MNPSINADFYEKTFLLASETQQYAFLKQVFANHESLQTEFITFIGNALRSTQKTKQVDENITALTASSDIDITETAKKVLELLKTLDLDSDLYDEEYPDADNEYDYYEDYDDDEDDDDDTPSLEEWAAARVNLILMPYHLEMDKYIGQGDFKNALAIILAVYATEDKLPELDDEYDDGDFSYAVCQFVDALEEAYIEHLITINPDTAQRAAAIKALIDYYESEKELAYIQYFTAMLTALVNDAPLGATVLTRLLANKTPQKEITDLLLHCATISQNNKIWLSIAEKTYKSVIDVAAKLMMHYYHTGEKTNFVRVAIAVNKNYETAFDDYLREHITLADDRKLYIELWERYVLKTQDISDYENLKAVFTPAERNDFINRLHKNTTFYAKILVAEGLLDDLLKFTNKVKPIMSFQSQNLQNDVWAIAAAHFPKEIFDLVTQKVLANEKYMGSNRSGYAAACNPLCVFKHIKGMNDSKAEFISALRQRYIKRPAFQEELSGQLQMK